MVTVSVVVPTYNREDTLPRALRSITGQTYGDTEIIVVDDASTDRTERVVTQQFPEVEYVRHDTNRGGSAARNTGIEVANGEYIAFLDSDDEWKAEKIERQVENIESKDENYGAIYTGVKIDRGSHHEVGKVPEEAGDIYKTLFYRDVVGPTSSLLINRECFDQVGGFREDLNARQDYEMWLRIAREYKFDYIKDPLTILHTESSNRISGNVSGRIHSHQKIIDEIEKEISEFSLKEKRRILAMQYFDLARYCQKNSQFKQSMKYFRKSVRLNPLYYKTWAAMGLSSLHISTRERPLLSLKNKLKNYD